MSTSSFCEIFLAEFRARRTALGRRDSLQECNAFSCDIEFTFELLGEGILDVVDHCLRSDPDDPCRVEEL